MPLPLRLELEGPDVEDPVRRPRFAREVLDVLFEDVVIGKNQRIEPRPRVDGG